MSEYKRLVIVIPHCDTICVVAEKEMITAINYYYNPYTTEDDDKKTNITSVLVELKKQYILIKKEELEKKIRLSSVNVIQQINGVIRSLLNPCHPWNIYHGISYILNGLVCVMLAPSQTGKSTLAAILKNDQTTEYLAEDLLLINSEKMEIESFRRPIHLRSGAVQYLEKAGIELNNKRKVTFRDYSRVCIMEKTRDCVKYTIDRFYVLKRQEGLSEIMIKDLVGQKLDMLFDNCSIPTNYRNNLIDSMVISEKMDLFEIRYGDTIDLAKNINKLIR